MDSNYLKVKAVRPPRRQSLLGKSNILDFEPNGVTVRMSVTEEDFEADRELGNCRSQRDMKTIDDVEFVALDVQALEKMRPCSSGMLNCNENMESAVMTVSPPKRISDIVRSATDFDLKSKRNESSYRRPGYDMCSIYDITEYPIENNGELPTGNILRSASASAYLLSTPGACSGSPAPQEISFLEEPLLLVGPKLEWEGIVKARKVSNAKRRKRRQQQMTPQELKKMTRIVIGYTLAFFLLVIVTFYIVYFV